MSYNLFKTMKIGKLVANEDLTLLGAPIYPEGIPNVLNPKLENLKLMTTRLDEIDPHQAFFLLRNCYSMPKFIYFLRTAPCFLEQGILGRYDEIMRMSLVKILNIQMSDRIWNQATLSFRFQYQYHQFTIGCI